MEKHTQDEMLKWLQAYMAWHEGAIPFLNSSKVVNDYLENSSKTTELSVLAVRMTMVSHLFTAWTWLTLRGQLNEADLYVAVMHEIGFDYEALSNEADGILRQAWEEDKRRADREKRHDVD